MTTADCCQQTTIDDSAPSASSIDHTAGTNLCAAAANNFCAYLCTFCPGTSFASMQLLCHHLQAEHRPAHDDDEEEEEGSRKEAAEEEGQSPEMTSEWAALRHSSAATVPDAASSPSAAPGISSSSASTVIKKEEEVMADAIDGGGNLVAQLTCKKCPGGRTFSSRHELALHSANTHRDRPHYSCAQCGAVFSIKRELATHCRIHSGEQPHQCGKCGKEFGTRQLLKKHNMWHDGARSHVCAHCGKAFFQKGHLTQHLMIHTGGRPHQCPLCLKTFIFKFDLNRHLKIHSERSFICRKCAKCFQLDTELDEHSAKCKGGGGGGGGQRRGSRSSLKKSPTPWSSSPGGLSSGSTPPPSTIIAEKREQEEQEEAMMEAKPDNGFKQEFIPVANDGDDTAMAPAAVQLMDAHAAFLQMAPPQPMMGGAGADYCPAANQQQQCAANAIGRLAAGLFAAQQNANAISAAFCHGQMAPQEQQLQFPCLLCPRKFGSQAAYLLHWADAHLRQSGGGGQFDGVGLGGAEAIMEEEGEEIHAVGQQSLREELLMQMAAQQQSSLVDISCALSSQKVSPSASSSSSSSSSSASTLPADWLPGAAQQLEVAHHHFPAAMMAAAAVNGGRQPSPSHSCPNCPMERQRLEEKERELGEMRAELDRVRVLFLRFGALFNAGDMAASFGQLLLGKFPGPN